MKKFFVFLLLLPCLLFSLSCQAQINSSDLKKVEVFLVSPDKKKKIQLRLEVADTEFTRMIGLMYREALPFAEGMIFLWPKDEVETRSFWMRNTIIPLDMIFAENEDIVGIVHSAEPRTDTPRGVGSGSNIAIEINGGSMRKWEANENWSLEFPESLSKVYLSEQSSSSQSD